MTASILGTGAIAPGAVGTKALIEVLSRPPTGDYRVATVGDEANLRWRRMPRIDRMAFAAAREALGTFDPADVALVYGTGYGGLGSTVDFLEGVAARGAEFGSPSAFHQSVHHAAAGQISIALGMRGLCLTVSSREISGEAALKVGLDLLTSGRASRVLVVAADEVVPALTEAYRAFGVLGEDGAPMQPGRRGVRPGEGAAAILLAPGDETGAPVLEVAGALVTAHPVSGLRYPADPALLAPLLLRARELAGAGEVRVITAGCGTEAEGPERDALRQAIPGAPTEDLAPQLGFNPAGGLLRIVAAAARIRSAGDAAVAHGLSLGGGQAATVLRRRVS